MKPQSVSKTEYLNPAQVIGYLQAHLADSLTFPREWDRFATVYIGLGWPRYPVKVSIHSLTMDRQAAMILDDLGIHDALATSMSYRNFNDDYLSISAKSLIAFGHANREKILEGEAQRSHRKSAMQQMYEMCVCDGLGEKLDYLIAKNASRGKGGAA